MQPIYRRRWQLRQNKPQPELVSELARLLHINPLTAQILVLRGISDVPSGEEFLRANLSCLPDPDLLPDMRIACQRIELALMHGERIAIHGDYDVDGISGCSLLVEVLRKLGAEVDYHIPLRLVDGYGLSAEALRKAAEHGCSLAISVDCGVSAVAEAELAAELGLDLIITDHHQPPDQLPRCLALINPHLSGCRFPWRELSGVGVAFFLLAGLRRRLRENGYFESHPEPDLRQSLDLVALGTIADIVPLGGVNRILTRSGLQLMERDSRPGLTALKQVADVKQVTSGVVGFRLARGSMLPVAWKMPPWECNCCSTRTGIWQDSQACLTVLTVNVSCLNRKPCRKPAARSKTKSQMTATVSCWLVTTGTPASSASSPVGW